MIMKHLIYKLDIPECSNYTFEVGEHGVIKIEEDVIKTGVGECYDPSKLIYRIVFDNGDNIEISANVRGIVLFRKYFDKD